MTRFKDREKALTLRKQGKSYSQIKKIIGVNKSTLHYWLKDYPLSKQRIRELRDWNEQRIEKFRETMRAKKEKRLKQFYDEQKKLFLPLKNREVFLAGLFLYWGEGSKTKDSYLSVANTDPSVIKFFIYWLIKELMVPRKKLRIHLHLYSDMGIEEKIHFCHRRGRIIPWKRVGLGLHRRPAGIPGPKDLSSKIGPLHQRRSRDDESLSAR